MAEERRGNGQDEGGMAAAEDRPSPAARDRADAASAPAAQPRDDRGDTTA